MNRRSVLRYLNMATQNFNGWTEYFIKKYPDSCLFFICPLKYTEIDQIRKQIKRENKNRRFRFLNFIFLIDSKRKFLNLRTTVGVIETVQIRAGLLFFSTFSSISFVVQDSLSKSPFFQIRFDRLFTGKTSAVNSHRLFFYL